MHLDRADLIAAALAPAHFVARALALEWENREEDVPWEIFRGCLLDPALTRQRRHFHAWNVHVTTERGRSAEPVLSVKLDIDAGAIHIVRALECYAWQAFDAGGNVIASREAVTWVRELVGTIALAEFATREELSGELGCRLFQAVVGTSRLPLTSLEAPLPAFSFGQLLYATQPIASWADLVRHSSNAALSWRERAKLLEFLIRAVPMAELDDAANATMGYDGGMGELLRLLRTMFNEASLSPYTDFVDKALGLVERLAAIGGLARVDQVDFIGFLLRQLGRHMTAYDLVTFHHRGANYPDALLLDAALKAYLRLADQVPKTFAGKGIARRHRRALRQGCLFRHRYQDHAVPDVPTSPGENARVLPAPWTRLPEEQVLQPGRRRRRLYAGEPLAGRLTPIARELLQQSLDDLACPEELRELGTGVFIDRPFGAGKAPGEPDQTPLVAYEAFSRRIARDRLRQLAGLAGALGLTFDVTERERQLEALPVAGLPISAVWTPERAIVSLADAGRVAEDFVLIRTLPSSVEELLPLLPVAELADRLGTALGSESFPHLIVRVPAAAARPDGRGYVVALFDSDYRKRAELEVNAAAGFRSRGGREWPAGGFRLL